MNEEKLKQFMVPILILVMTLLGVLYFGPKVFRNVSDYVSSNAQLKVKIAERDNKQNQLQSYKQQEAAEARNNSKSSKPFYKPIESGLDRDAVITGEFAEVLELIRANQIKVRSIKYDYDPEEDNFVKNAKDRYHVARLNMEMISNYANYNNFLKEMYKHEHFLDIQSVEIVPYLKNRKVLLVSFKVKLYGQK